MDIEELIKAIFDSSIRNDPVLLSELSDDTYKQYLAILLQNEKARLAKIEAFYRNRESPPRDLDIVEIEEVEEDHDEDDGSK